MAIADVTVAFSGTVVLFTLSSDAAREFIDQQVHLEPWQWVGGISFAVDRRFAGDLIDAMIADGLEVTV